MPIRQTGNWGPLGAVSPVGIDVSEYAPAASTPLLAMLGYGGPWETNVPWWSANPVNGNFFWQNVGGNFDGFSRQLLSSNEASHASIAHDLPMIIGAMSVPAVNGGEPLPTLRVRVSMLAQVIGPAALPVNGLISAIAMGGSDIVGTDAHVGVVVSGAGIYTGISERLSAGRTVTPVSGAINATVPHMIEFEYLLGPAQRLRISVAGTQVYDKTFAGAMFSRAIGFSSGQNMKMVFYKAGAAGGPFGFWALYGTRIRYDYV